jgi:hypothetical protein
MRRNPILNSMQQPMRDNTQELVAAAIQADIDEGRLSVEQDSTTRNELADIEGGAAMRRHSGRTAVRRRRGGDAEVPDIEVVAELAELLRSGIENERQISWNDLADVEGELHDIEAAIFAKFEEMDI